MRKLRDTRNLIQDQLARACQRLGWDVSRVTLTKIENGRRLGADPAESSEFRSAVEVVLIADMAVGFHEEDSAVLVAEPDGDGGDFHAVFDAPGGEKVPEVEDPQVRQLQARASVVQGLPGASDEEEGAGGLRVVQCGQDLAQRFGNRDPADAPFLVPSWSPVMVCHDHSGVRSDHRTLRVSFTR